MYIIYLCVHHHRRYRLTELICSVYNIMCSGSRYIFVHAAQILVYLCLINFVNSTKCREWAKWRKKKKIIKRESVQHFISAEKKFSGGKKSLSDHRTANIKSRYYDFWCLSLIYTLECQLSLHILLHDAFMCSLH